jgi:hypothetical protein
MLALKNPFRGAKWLVEKMHNDLLTALNQLPPGAVFQVFSVNYCCISPFYLFKIPKKASIQWTRTILREMGLVSRAVVFKPLLTKKHRRARREFGQKYRRMNTSFWKKIIFSDEKIFRCCLVSIVIFSMFSISE